MTIGERIKQRREFLGMSQEDLAQKLNYKSRSTINKIEMGINDITQTKITAFAEALDTTPAHLMGWEDHSEDEAKKLNQHIKNVYGTDAVHMLDLFCQLNTHDKTNALINLNNLLDKGTSNLSSDNYSADSDVKYTEKDINNAGRRIYEVLLSCNLIKKGQDLTPAQIDFLDHLSFMITSYFNKDTK